MLNLKEDQSESKSGRFEEVWRKFAKALSIEGSSNVSRRSGRRECKQLYVWKFSVKKVLPHWKGSPSFSKEASFFPPNSRESEGVWFVECHRFEFAVHFLLRAIACYSILTLVFQVFSVSNGLHSKAKHWNYTSTCTSQSLKSIGFNPNWSTRNRMGQFNWLSCLPTLFYAVKNLQMLNFREYLYQRVFRE